MNLLKLIPTILSFILIGAHLMRIGFFPLNFFCFILPFILFIRQAWVVRVVQVLLLLGTAEWIRALYAYIEIRQSTGQDSSRLIIILGSVALFTLLSALLFQTKSLKQLYQLKK